MDADRLRTRLVERLRAKGELTREDVTAAFRTVPREVFLPGLDVAEVYEDEALVTKRDEHGQPISSSSQPAIMAVMLEQLDIQPGHWILEIGAGTGYNAALMAELTGAAERVVSVDIDAEVIAHAQTSIAVAGYPRTRLICADGAHGYPNGAPYDRIIATVGVWDLAPAWLDQLAPGGRLVVPLDLAGVQRSVAFEREDDRFSSRSVVACGFMRMRGSFAGPERVRVLDRAADRMLTVHDGRKVDADVLAGALAGEHVVVSSALSVTMREMFDGVMLWLAGCGISRVDVSEKHAASRSLLGPTHLDFGNTKVGAGIAEGDSLAVLVRSRLGKRLEAKGFGPEAEAIARRLIEQVCCWDAAGRPASAGLRVDAYPYRAGVPAVAADRVIDKVNTRLVLSWS